MAQNILSPGYENSTTVRNAYSNYTVYLAQFHQGLQCKNVYLNYIPNLYPLHTQCIPTCILDFMGKLLGTFLVRTLLLCTCICILSSYSKNTQKYVAKYSKSRV